MLESPGYSGDARIQSTSVANLSLCVNDGLILIWEEELNDVEAVEFRVSV